MRYKLDASLIVIMVLSMCLLVVTIACLGKSNNQQEIESTPVDTIVAEPSFMTQSPQEGLKEALDYYGLSHTEIVYAQAVLETGNFKSNICINRNNLFGLYNSKRGEYYRFDHWTESVEAYRDWIQNRYKPPEDYYSFLRRINYASDSLYIGKLKQIVKRNEKRRGIGAYSSDSLFICTPSIPNRIW